MSDAHHDNKAKKESTATTEWVRPGALQQLFGITRPAAYILAERGEIEISQIKAPGARRGICLVSVDSVRRMIERHRSKPAPKAIGGAS